jgi:hypothetical protein
VRLASRCHAPSDSTAQLWRTGIEPRPMGKSRRSGFEDRPSRETESLEQIASGYPARSGTKRHARPARLVVMRMRAGIVLIGVVAALTATSPAQAGPVRSGIIVLGSYGARGIENGCEGADDCRAWRDVDCDPALAGLNPAISSSIVDVGDLARSGKVRRFSVYDDMLVFVWGGASVQFWTEGCDEVRARPSVPQDFGAGGGFLWSAPCSIPRCPYVGSAKVKVPASATWMTVTSHSGSELRWELS